MTPRFVAGVTMWMMGSLNDKGTRGQGEGNIWIHVWAKYVGGVLRHPREQIQQ